MVDLDPTTEVQMAPVLSALLMFWKWTMKIRSLPSASIEVDCLDGCGIVWKYIPEENQFHGSTRVEVVVGIHVTSWSLNANCINCKSQINAHDVTCHYTNLINPLCAFTNTFYIHHYTIQFLSSNTSSVCDI